MRKSFAILLLAIHLFNLAGYRLLYAYFADRSEQQLITTLDNGHYNNDELVEIKIPLNLPYIQGNFQYERVDGSLEFEGIHYNYVKRRVLNDTLSVLCIPNKKTTEILAKGHRVTGQLADHPLDKKTKIPGLKKSLPATDYDSHNPAFLVGLLPPQVSSDAHPLSFRLPSTPHVIPELPPQVIA